MNRTIIIDDLILAYGGLFEKIFWLRWLNDFISKIPNYNIVLINRTERIKHTKNVKWSIPSKEFYSNNIWALDLHLQSLGLTTQNSLYFSSYPITLPSFRSTIFSRIQSTDYFKISRSAPDFFTQEFNLAKHYASNSLSILLPSILEEKSLNNLPQKNYKESLKFKMNPELFFIEAQIFPEKPFSYTLPYFSDIFTNSFRKKTFFVGESTKIVKRPLQKPKFTHKEISLSQIDKARVRFSHTTPDSIYLTYLLENYFGIDLNDLFAIDKIYIDGFWIKNFIHNACQQFNPLVESLEQTIALDNDNFREDEKQFRLKMNNLEVTS